MIVYRNSYPTEKSETKARIEYNGEIKTKFGDLKKTKHSISSYVFEDRRIFELDVQEPMPGFGMLGQEIWCNRNKRPMFAPIDGICWNCNKVLIDRGDVHITGCPYCNKSYCE